MKWILNHLKTVAAIITFGITVIVTGVIMLNSYNAYKDYETKYYENDLAVRSANAAAPKLVEINNEFKSKYDKKLVAGVDEMKYTTNQEDYAPVDGYLPSIEGSITLDLHIDAKSFVDIDFVINSSTTENVLADMSVKVNGSLIEEDDIKIEKDGEDIEWHHLVMSNFALPEGNLTIEIANVKDKKAPDVKNIIVYANANISLATAD